MIRNAILALACSVDAFVSRHRSNSSDREVLHGLPVREQPRQHGLGIVLDYEPASLELDDLFRESVAEQFVSIRRHTIED